MPRIQRTLASIHLYAGLVAAPLLLLLGLTGSVLSLEYPLDRALNPGLNYATPQPVRVSLDELAATVKAAHPEARLVSLALSPYSNAPGIAYTAQLKPERTVYLDPYTARMLGERTRPSFTTRVHDLHTNLMTGEDGPGGFLLFLTAVALVVLSVTGIILWWPRRIVRVNWQASGRRITFDLHNAVGFFSFAFMLLFAGTAIVIHTLSVVLPATNRALKIEDSEPALHASSMGSAVSLNTIAQAAAGALPGARVTYIALPKPEGVFRVSMKFPEDGTPLGRSTVLIDPPSAKVLWQRSSRTAPITTRYFRQWNREMHTGDLFGWPTRLLLCGFSLALPVLAVTGPLFWFRRVRRRPQTAR